MTEIDFYIHIAKALDDIGARYMIVGAFAATAFGLTRTTQDVDILVDLDEAQIDLLAASFPAPRYYADAEMMRDSMQRGIMFNIIDSESGLKADLVPLTREPEYERAFARRIRRQFRDVTGEIFEAWYAQPTDVIIGKLRAWTEGRSSKHPGDIHQMLVYLLSDPHAPDVLLADIEEAATELGEETLTLWHELFVQAAIDAQQLQKSRGQNP